MGAPLNLIIVVSSRVSDARLLAQAQVRKCQVARVRLTLYTSALIETSFFDEV